MFFKVKTTWKPINKNCLQVEDKKSIIKIWLFRLLQKNKKYFWQKFFFCFRSIGFSTFLAELNISRPVKRQSICSKSPSRQIFVVWANFWTTFLNVSRPPTSVTNLNCDLSRICLKGEFDFQMGISLFFILTTQMIENVRRDSESKSLVL